MNYEHDEIISHIEKMVYFILQFCHGFIYMVSSFVPYATSYHLAVSGRISQSTVESGTSLACIQRILLGSTVRRNQSFSWTDTTALILRSGNFMSPTSSCCALGVECGISKILLPTTLYLIVFFFWEGFLYGDTWHFFKL